METQYINLNMTPIGVTPTFHISQYDVGRMLGFIVHSGGATVDLDTYTCTVEATRSDGTAITSAVATTDNIGTFEVTPTMSNKADKYKCQLVIVDANSKRIASLPFDMEVTKAAMDEDSESIEEDASLYQQYTGAVKSAIADINADMQTEKTSRATTDASLQAQINQLVAPSGEAPSAAEVQNARIGADSRVYDTLGSAIRSQVTDLKSAINNVSDIIGGVAQLDFVRGTIYQGRALTTESLEQIVMPDYITLDYDVTVSVADGYRYMFQRVVPTGNVVDEFGQNTSVSAVSTSDTTFSKNIPFRLNVKKIGSTWNVPCDIAELQFALSVDNNRVQNLYNTRIYDFESVQIDSASYNKTISDYSQGITIEKIGYNKNSIFPSKAGFLYTIKLWSNNINYQKFVSYDYIGTFMRKVDTNGAWKRWSKIIEEYNLDQATYQRTTKKYNRIPIVTFIDDDGSVQVYNKYKPLAIAYNVPFCSAVCTRFVGGNDGREVGDFLSWEQIEELYSDYGFEFLCHSWSHKDYRTLTDAEIVSEMNQNKLDFINHRIPIRGISYPNEGSNKTVRKYASQFFDYGFTGEDFENLYQVNIDCIPSYYITRCTMGSYFDRTGSVDGVPVYKPGDQSAPQDAIFTNSWDYYKLLLDKCISEKGWLVFCLHAWHPSFDATQMQYLENIIQYCQNNGIYIETASSAYDMFKNAFETGDYLGNWNREGYAINQDGLIDAQRYKNTDGTVANEHLSSFPMGQITMYTVYDSGNHFPSVSGLLETHRISEPTYSFQLFYPSLSHEIWQRKFNANGEPLSWVKIAQAIT